MDYLLPSPVVGAPWTTRGATFHCAVAEGRRAGARGRGERGDGVGDPRQVRAALCARGCHHDHLMGGDRGQFTFKCESYYLTIDKRSMETKNTLMMTLDPY